MHVSIETLSELQRRMTIRLPSEAFYGEFDKRLRDTARRARIPGFRPGRVPLPEVRRRFGQELQAEISLSLMQQSFADAVSEQSFRLAGRPQLQPPPLGDQVQEFEFTATFEVLPEFAMADLSTLTLSRPTTQITDEDVQATVQSLRERNPRYEDQPQREVAQGDRVTLDFVSYWQDEPVDGGAAKDMQLVLGRDNLLPGFEQQLLGLVQGQEKRFQLTMPEHYHDEKLRNREVSFVVTVKQVEQPLLPALDAKFFAELGVQDLDNLHTRVRADMEQARDDAIRREERKQVFDALLPLHVFSLPAVMVGEEMLRQRQRMLQQIGGQSEMADSLPEQLFREPAERSVRMGLILARIVEHLDIKPDPARVQTILERIAESAPSPSEVKGWYHASPERMQQLASMALEEQVVEQVLQQAQISEQPCTFDELMALANQASESDQEEDQEASEDSGDTDGKS